MAFRSDETSKALIQDAQNYLVGRDFPKELRQHVRRQLKLVADDN
jgi:hypothetical protein